MNEQGIDKQCDIVVYLAYYHNGFTDDQVELLDVCESRDVAELVLAKHKRERNREYEYKNDATWWIDDVSIRTMTGIKNEKTKH